MRVTSPRSSASQHPTAFSTLQESRPALFMLRAFNIDTSMIAESVRSKEPALVQVRDAHAVPSTGPANDLLAGAQYCL